MWGAKYHEWEAERCSVLKISFSEARDRANPNPAVWMECQHSRCHRRKQPAGVQTPGELAESLNCTHKHTSLTNASSYRMCLLHLQHLPFNSAELWGGFESGKKGFFLSFKLRDKSGLSNSVFRDTIKSFNARGCLRKCTVKSNGKKKSGTQQQHSGEKRFNCVALEPVSLGLDI